PDHRSINLKVHCPVCVPILETDYRVRGRLHVHSIAAYLKLGRRRRFLPSDAPVWRDPTDVVGSASWIRLRSTYVLRAINSCIQIQMIVPHCVATESCDVLRQTASNDGSGSRSGCEVARDPRET